MDPDAFIVAFRSSELDLAGEVDAVDDVLEGIGGDGELMLLVVGVDVDDNRRVAVMPYFGDGGGFFARMDVFDEVHFGSFLC